MCGSRRSLLTVSDTINLHTGVHAGGAIVTPRRYRPLGGDGFSAPLSMYEVGISLAGNGSGGIAQLIIEPDERFESLLILCQMTMTSATAAIECFFQLSIDSVFSRAFIDAVPLDSMQSFNSASWNPPPILAFTDARIIIPEPGVGPVLTTSWFVYNFNIRASELTPMQTILASLPRSSEVQG